MKLADIPVLALPYYKAKKTPYFKSPPGRGKTTVISSLPAMLGKALGKRMGFVLINGPLLNVPDTIGYLVPREKNGVMASEFTRPFWWYTDEGQPLEAYEGGIIFVDEADKADIDVKKILGEGALSGRLGSHRLPPGWVIWMAGNRSIDRSGSTKELDHLINRRFEHDLQDDMEGWKDWAFSHGVDPAVIHFADQNPQIVFNSEIPEKQGPWCTPRSLVATADVLHEMRGSSGKLPTDALAIEVAQGAIGQAAAAQLFASIRLSHEMPSLDDIIRNPEGTRVPSKTDAQMLVCYNLAARVTEETVGPVVTYMERLPKEFSVTFARTACRREAALVNTAAFAGWAARNASIMAAVASRG